MSLKEQMETGKVYIEFGHASEEDQAYEQVIEEQRQIAKEICFDYNNTRPMDVERKDELLSHLLGSRGKSIWMEAPIHFAYGCNTHMGDHVYANFNLTIVDDGQCRIGNYVMFAPTSSSPPPAIRFIRPCATRARSSPCRSSSRITSGSAPT